MAMFHFWHSSPSMHSSIAVPAVSFVDPRFTLLLNTANDNHTESDIRSGDAFVAEVYRAVATSLEWNSTVLVLNYDEWGGFFDHVPPPRHWRRTVPIRTWLMARLCWGAVAHV
jgi:phospholipase C